MTIDEAIKHCEEKAKELSEKADCIECAKEHEQLAEWLKELAAYQKLFESPKEAEEVLNMLSV